MEKKVTFLLALALWAGACSSNESEVKILPSPDHEGIVDEVDTLGIKEAAPGEVHVIVVDAEEHGEQVVAVLNGALVPAAAITPADEENYDQCFFSNHEDIKLHLIGNFDDFNPDLEACDIVNCSFSLNTMDAARQFVAQFEDTDKFREFPLLVVCASNGDTTFFQELWDLCEDAGGLSWYDNVLPYFGYDQEDEDNGNVPDSLLIYNVRQNVAAAYIVQDVKKNGHAKDIIIAGVLCEENSLIGNRPGPILKDRFICTYNEFDVDGKQVQGSDFSTPYATKIIAEIKRRVPHYTHDEIAQLLFSTADDLGAPGCDEVFGWGRMNPTKIWQELARLGY